MDSNSSTSRRSVNSNTAVVHASYKSTKDRVFEINGKTVVKKTMWTKGGTEFMNGATFSIEATHGCFQQIINSNVYLVNSATLLFISGKHLVIFDIATRKQKIVMKAQEDQQVTCMKYYQKSVHASIHIAVGLKTLPKTHAQAKIYNSKKAKSSNLVHSHLPLSAEIDLIDNLHFVCPLNGEKKLVTVAEVEMRTHLSVWVVKSEVCVCTSHVDFSISKLIRAPLSEDEFMSFNATQFHIWHNKSGVEELGCADYKLRCCSASSQKSQPERIIDMVFLEGTPYNAVISSLNVLYFSKTNNLIETVALFNNFPEYAASSYCTCLTSMCRGFGVGFGGGFNGVHVYRLQGNMEKLVYEREISIEPFQTDLSKLQIHSTISIQCDKDERFMALSVLYNQRESSTQQYKKQKNIDLINENAKQNTTSSNSNSVANNGSENNNNSKSPSSTAVQKAKKALIQLSNKQHNFQENELHKQQSRRIELLLFDFTQLNAMEYKFFERPFEPVFDFGVLNGSIVDISVCPSKNAILIISDDNQLMIFEMQTSEVQYKCTFLQTFSEKMTAISIHPLFIQVAIGFKEELKIGYLVGQELVQVFSDPLKSCLAVRYNASGSLLAAASYSNINVYSPFTFEVLFVLVNTNTNASINQIRWSNQDTVLTSSCVQGTLQCWSVTRRQKMMEHSSKQASKFSCLFYDSEYDLIVRCTLDHKLKIYSEKGSSMVYELDVSPATLTCVLLIKEMNVILFGTSNGTIRMYLWPFDMSLKAQEFSEIAVHQNEVRCLSVSKDFTWIFSGSTDGDIFFLKMREFQDGLEVFTQQETRRIALRSLNMAEQHTQQQQQHQQQQNNSRSTTQQAVSTNAFISQETRLMLNKFFDYTDQNRINSDYHFILRELGVWNQSSLVSLKDELKELDFRMNDMSNDIGDKKEKDVALLCERIDEVKEELEVKAETEGMQLDRLRTELDKQIEQASKDIETLQADFQKEVQRIEGASNTKLLELYEQYSLMHEKKRTISEAIGAEIAQKREDCESVKQRKIQKYESKYRMEEEKYTTAVTKIRISELEFQEIQRQEEEEFAEYLELIKEKLTNEKKVQTKRTEDLRTLNTKSQKGIEGFLEKKQLAERQIFELKIQIEQQENSISALKGKQTHLMTQLKEKEEIINNKEQEIQYFRSKNQHLQNFRAVYDYKVQILYDEQDPLQNHLTEIENKIKNVYKDLLKQAGRKEQVEKRLNAQQLTLEEKRVQLQRKRELIREMNYKIESFQFEVNAMLKKLEFESWLGDLQAVNEKYFHPKKNVIDAFRNKNTAIGWKNMEKTSSILSPVATAAFATAAAATPTAPIIVQTSNLTAQELAEKEQEEKHLKEIAQLNKKAKIINNVLNTNHNSSNGTTSKSTPEEDKDIDRNVNDSVASANQQNLFLLSECNKLVKERKQLKEDLQKLNRAYQLIEQENSNGSNRKSSASHNAGGDLLYPHDLDIMTDFITNPKLDGFPGIRSTGTLPSNRYYSPSPLHRSVQQQSQLQHSSNRDSSAGKERSFQLSLQQQKQMKGKLPSNLRQPWHLKESSRCGSADGAQQRQMERMIKDMAQFRKAAAAAATIDASQAFQGDQQNSISGGAYRQQQQQIMNSQIKAGDSTQFRDIVTISDEPLGRLVQRNLSAAHLRKVKPVSPPPPSLQSRKSPSPKQKNIRVVQAPQKIALKTPKSP